MQNKVLETLAWLKKRQPGFWVFLMLCLKPALGRARPADQRLILLGAIWQPYNAYSYLAKSTLFFPSCQRLHNAYVCLARKVLLLKKHNFIFFLVCPRRMGLSTMSKEASSNFKTWHFRSKYSVAFTFQFPSSTTPRVLQDCYSNIIFANLHWNLLYE